MEADLAALSCCRMSATGQELTIVVTRRGQPVVELKPVQPPLRRMTAADLEWLRSHRIRRISQKDAATLVREMRDEEWK